MVAYGTVCCQKRHRALSVHQMSPLFTIPKSNVACTVELRKRHGMPILAISSYDEVALALHDYPTTVVRDNRQLAYCQACLAAGAGQHALCSWRTLNLPFGTDYNTVILSTISFPIALPRSDFPPPPFFSSNFRDFQTSTPTFRATAGTPSFVVWTGYLRDALRLLRTVTEPRLNCFAMARTLFCTER